MEQAVGMETALFGGPPELGNMLKLANGQIGFMTIFAHPLFANVSDVIPAMRFASEEILTNKGVWFTRAEQEKRMQLLKMGSVTREAGAVSPRTRSPPNRRGTVDNGKDKHGNLPTSPLRGRADASESTPKGLGVTQSASSENATPQITSRTSSLAAAAGIAVTSTDSTALKHAASSQSQAYVQPSLDGSSSNSAVVNGEPSSTNNASHQLHSGPDEDGTDNSTPKLSVSGTELSSESLQALSDKRRDNAVSMRAGSESIPAEAWEAEKQEMFDTGNASKFTFATSIPEEPIRTYDPERGYTAAHASARASAPASDEGFKHHEKDSADDSRTARLTQSENASTILRKGGDEGLLNAGQSTDTTNSASEVNEDGAHNHNSFQSSRNRVASAPAQSPSPGLRPSFSMGSNSATSRESSKLDIHATILSNGNGNGNGDDSGGKDRQVHSKTMGRKRSKLKLGLAFWKRSRSDKSIEEDRRPDSQGSEGG